jgi:hypothetical protein
MGALSPGKTPQLAESRWISLLLLFAICFFLIGGFLGFEAGNTLRLDVIYDVPCTLRALRSLIPDSGMLLTPIFFTVEPLSIAFTSNRTFLQRPSNESNAIWSTLYPGNHGFFNYPDKNPRRSTFAGFHQLHCVVRFLFSFPLPYVPSRANSLTGLLTHSFANRIHYVAASTKSGMLKQPWKMEPILRIYLQNRSH